MLHALDPGEWPISITPLASDHAAAMADVHARSFPQPWGADDLRVLVEAPYCLGIAASWDVTLAGFIILSVAADEAEIITLAVDTPWRRRGIGRLLLEDAMGKARDRGAAVMLLEVGVRNLAAQSLYTCTGFCRIGRRRQYYTGPNGTEDALVMRLDLGPRVG